MITSGDQEVRKTHHYHGCGLRWPNFGLIGRNYRKAVGPAAVGPPLPPLPLCVRRAGGHGTTGWTPTTTSATGPQHSENTVRNSGEGGTEEGERDPPAQRITLLTGT